MVENGGLDKDDKDTENAIEDVKGKFKGAVGAVTGNDDLAEEGKAQQAKAKREGMGGGARVSGERAGREW